MHLIYGLQWVIYNVGILLTIPIVGHALQLNPLEIATLIQRLFLLTGIASLLQVIFGHRFLLIEGPAAPWCAAFIVLATVTGDTGGSMATLRTDLQGAMLIAGIILIILGGLGILRRMLSFFTPTITGTVLMLIALQIGGIGVKGIFAGLAETTLGAKLLLIPCVVIAVIVTLSLRGKGLLRTVAIIMGIAVGWLIYRLGKFPALPVENSLNDTPFIMLPQLFPWGTPTFNPDVIIPLVLLGLVLIPNAVISMNAMQNTIQADLPKKRYDRGLIVSGFSDFLAGLIGSVGTIPYATSVGLVALTGIKDRLPFIIGCLIYIGLGIFPAIGSFIAHIPPSIANAVLIVSASPLIIYALRDFTRCSLDNRDAFVIGLSLLTGIGLMLAPAETLRNMPIWIANILGNGVIAGALICLILEHVLLRKPKEEKPGLIKDMLF